MAVHLTMGALYDCAEKDCDERAGLAGQGLGFLDRGVFAIELFGGGDQVMVGSEDIGECHLVALTFLESLEGQAAGGHGEGGLLGGKVSRSPGQSAPIGSALCGELDRQLVEAGVFSDGEAAARIAGRVRHVE